MCRAALLRSLARCGSIGAIGVLAGCPQLLEDDFTPRDGLAPPVSGDAGARSGLPDGELGLGGNAGDGSAGWSGASGLGGSAHAGGTAGVDSSAAGGGQGGAGEPDPLVVLQGALVHRYSFNDTGSPVLVDSVGGKHGSFERVVAGAPPTLDGTGSLVLDGTLYGELPSSLISSHLSVSIEAWVKWSGGAAWQRIFDFGSNENGSGQQGGSPHHLYLTPSNNAAITVLGYKGTDGAGLESHGVTLPGGFPQGSVQQVAVVIDGSSSRMYFYYNGQEQGYKPLSAEEPLSKIPDENNWLGRSQSPDDPYFTGELLDFRIYDTALSAAALAFSYDQGPDAAINP